MDFNQLQFFLDVAKLLNFSEAAKKNHISQPAISNSITTLEKQLGTKLFARNTHEVVLTKSGEILLPYAEEAIRALEIAAIKIGDVNKYHGELMLVINPALSNELSKCLVIFTKKYANFYINIRYSMDFIRMLDDEDADICFGFSFSRDQRHSRRVIEKLHDSSMVAVYPSEWTHKSEPFSYSMFEDKSFLVINPMINKRIYQTSIQMCTNNYFSPRVRGYYDDAFTLMSAVENGLGYTIVPRCFCDRISHDNVNIIELSGEDSIVDVSYAYKKNQKNPVVNVFLETLKEYFKK